ncbi:4-hydroxythreonine-4-phosphate dehydrogenase PdxA [Aliiroseovarius subalbicans]|uniref:4-hydroxythreonine-4-phosphate dehydrogenase PdxA n=1 Tax=Aliiroseovarius subalbicans TaxID=2925840 RepID=UPI001F575ECD|nr:4-hydroxythreonine-4-phosphate dehydrogenase PdxA [Aliiroseovarius subalbicans]MCI2398160.1 4-hydroxythreonine-4-phosphate dehydrogenase PdxA [Aliiroseovarius subalbicans]
MTIAPIALSVGEPAGIGPEIAAKAWGSLRADLPFFVIGDPDHFSGLAPLAEISSPDEAPQAAKNALPILPRDFGAPRVPGQPNPTHAQAVIDAIAEGVRLVQSGAASAVTTAPIHKKALKDGASFGFPGHTEFLAHLGGVDDVVMMLACDALKVVPATIHIPLSDVPKALTRNRLETTIRITHAAMQNDFGLPAPRIAVAGLNPHAGEGGAMGREEVEMITPLLDDLRAEGLELSGPLPADTMFHPAARARYDVAIGMYHDQALVPIKTLDFASGVNVTLGLPFIRTSPDHGTAFDIAGTGQADPSSLIAALKMARQMVKARA